MKTKIFTLIMIAFGLSVVYAQPPKTERTKTDKMVSVTMYHDNGAVAQTGFLKNNKLEGVWESFDAQGNKKAVGHYDQGIKTGKWFFWTGEQLAEVDYEENRIENVIYWNSDRTASR
jgi:antitoxin component YwqK of YwqJK toxin-antitoxin module